MRFVFFTFALAVSALAFSAPATAQPASDGWISHRTAAATTGPVVLHFRRAFELASVPKAMPVTVTADNRFILFANGRRIASGPSTGTIARWRTQSVDLAPYLHRGPNVIAAVVWDFVRKAPDVPANLPAASALPPQVAPIAQQSVGLGFRLTGGPLSTGTPGWRVKVDSGHSAANGRGQVPRGLYYVASAPEVIDAVTADWDWAGPKETGRGWEDAVPAPQAANRTLVADFLPPAKFFAGHAGNGGAQRPGRRRKISRPSGYGPRK